MKGLAILIIGLQYRYCAFIYPAVERPDGVRLGCRGTLELGDRETRSGRLSFVHIKYPRVGWTSTYSTSTPDLIAAGPNLRAKLMGFRETSIWRVVGRIVAW